MGLSRSIIIAMLLILVPLPIYADELTYIKRGTSAEKKGQFKKAIIEYEKALSENPNLTELYVGIGFIYRHKLHDLNKAIETYLRGLEVTPDDFDLNLNVMYSYFEINDLQNGKKYYKLLSKKKREKRRYSFPRETVNKIFEGKDDNQIIVFCNEYLTINPSDIIIREKLATIHKKQKKYNLAKKEFETLLHYGNTSSMVYFELGICYFHLGEYRGALEYLLKARDLGEYVPEQLLDKIHQEIAKKAK